MKPKAFKPTREEQEQAMQEVSKFLSRDKVLKSPDYPELEVRGKREQKNPRQDKI